MKTYKDVLQNKDHTALIPFFVLGDPDFETSFELIKTAIDSGADVLELGIAFSDPIADGPTIQKADIRALNSGMNCLRAFELISRIKAYKDIPIGLLMYYNLICNYGTEKFFKDAAGAGVNSVLIADLSIDDADEVIPAMDAANLDTVFMVTSITDKERMHRIADKTTGFIYAVSLLGVTGSRNTVSDTVGDLVKNIQEITDVPVCVGFGISSAKQAETVAQTGAQGVIIGSRIVGIIEANLKDVNKMQLEISNFLRDVRAVL